MAKPTRRRKATDPRNRVCADCDGEFRVDEMVGISRPPWEEGEDPEVKVFFRLCRSCWEGLIGAATMQAVR